MGTVQLLGAGLIGGPILAVVVSSLSGRALQRCGRDDAAMAAEVIAAAAARRAERAERVERLERVSS